MTVAADIERLSRAILYEGYLLYPYHRDALKNRSRFTFGDLEPGGTLQAECLVVGDESAIQVVVRFLDDTVEERIETEWVPLALLPRAHVGVELVATAAGDAMRLTVRVTNTRATRMLATQALLRVQHGEFVSLVDPPDALRVEAAACRNIGTWPVLVGAHGKRDCMLAAPIILEDYPRIAPESPGDLFDGTETDELLTLSILALPEEERRAIVDPRARAMLERTSALGVDQLRALHGRLQRTVRVGDRVRLRPKARADVFDVVLAGKAATVVAVEQDLEGRVHVAVTIDEDPGADLGEHAHRFFFGVDELEPV